MRHDRPPWAQALRQLRKRRDLKQEAVAEALKLDPRSYRGYELGERRPPRDTLIRLALDVMSQTEADTNSLLDKCGYDPLSPIDRLQSTVRGADPAAVVNSMSAELTFSGPAPSSSELLDQFQSRTYQAVHQHFTASSLDELARILPVLDALLLRMIEVAFVQTCARIPGVQCAASGEINIGNQFFSFQLHQPRLSRRPEVLEMSLTPGGEMMSDTLIQAFSPSPFRRAMRYQSVRIVLPPLLADLREFFRDIADTIFHAGYAVFYQRLDAVIRESCESPLSKAVYECLNRCAGRNPLKNVAFTIPRDGHIVYLVDSDLRRRADLALRARPDSFPEGPQQALISLLNLRIPRKFSQSQAVVNCMQEGDHKPVDLSRAVCPEETSLLIRSEKTFFGNTDLTTNPMLFVVMAKEGDGYLNALCPQSRKTELLPILNRAQPEIKNLFRNTGF